MVIGIVGIVLLSRLHEALGELAAAWPPLEGGGSKLPQERLPMRKIKEVLRLQSLGLSQRQIAASCAVGQATVSDYLKTAEAAGLRWPDIAEWSEDQVMQAVAPSREKPGQRNQSPEPDYAAIRHELQTHKHVTLQLLWEEYRETIRKATATAASVIYTKDGFGDKKSFCDTSIGRARSYLSTTPGIPFPSTLVRAATRRRRRSSSRYWEPATTVTRWQVELFFKALKQTLKIKTFVGTSANAVRTQVWTALIAMLVLKYLQLKSKFSWSSLAALLRQQLLFDRDLWAWLDDPFQAPPALAGVHDDAQQLEITW